VLHLNGRELLPLAGISGKTTVLCNEMGEYVNYFSDERGFHNPTGIWNLARADIVAIGDSYVHGVCVPSNDNFTAQLRRNYPATVNLGIAGNGPLLELATLIEYGPVLAPTRVLWFFYEGNDLQDLRRESAAPFLMRYFDGAFSQDLVSTSELDSTLAGYVDHLEAMLNSHQKEEAAILPSLWSVTRRTMTLTGLRQRLGLIYGGDGTDLSKGFEADISLLHRTLVRAKEVVRQWGGHFYIVYLPDRDRFVYDETRSKNETIRKRVLGIAQSEGIPVLDIYEVFNAQADPLALFPFRRTFHYTQDANRLIADEVLRFIQDDGRKT